jgi:tetratricopeptide (TPR) repeat protein
VIHRLMLLGLLGLAATLRAADAGDLVREALAAEARLDSRMALQFFLKADVARPNDAFILQKIARQYSDLVVEQPDAEAKQRYAQTALDYARRAVALKPEDPINVLSLAVCHGKLAVYSDTKTKIRYSRLVKEEAERALALDPNYAWAHHLLGRWHYEVAGLGATSKFFVRLFYGGLPPASFDEGIRHLRRATELEPDELNHWLELGFAQAAAGQSEAARAEWTRGLAMPSRNKHDEPAKQRARAALAQLD